MWWRSAYCPAAASTPTWRMPPPIRLRIQRARSIRSAELMTREPIGAPSPLDRQTDSVSNSCP
jgi:hypothetical protein